MRSRMGSGSVRDGWNATGVETARMCISRYMALLSLRLMSGEYSVISATRVMMVLIGWAARSRSDQPAASCTDGWLGSTMYCHASP